jgi:ketosteroid isomerase-like protein
MATRVDAGPAAFELEQLDVADGQLVISGHWTGVRGMRFMRPTLTVAGRRLLASLEHKPWAPDTAPWTAAFAWDAGEIDRADAWLSVAPNVNVRLVPGEPPPAPSASERHDAERVRFERRETEVDFLRDELRRAAGERDRSRAQLDEAVRDREAANRTRDRMEHQRAAAVDGERSARGKLDGVLAERDEARRQRDEVLLAYRALEREQARAARAEQQAPPAAEPEPPAPEREPPAAKREPRDEDEQPIGVRAIPATRMLAADLESVRHQHDLSRFDLYAFRAVGAVAAICFVLLLVAVLRVFL